jgi:hypothetical protein
MHSLTYSFLSYAVSDLCIFLKKYKIEKLTVLKCILNFCNAVS